MGEVDLGSIRIHQRDCIAGMQELLPDGSIDVVVTSPPYNLGVNYGVHADHGPRSDYLEWCGRWGDEIRRVLSSDGSFFLNVGGAPRDPWVPFEVLTVFRARFQLQNVLHWVKSIAISARDVGKNSPVQADLAVGHYKPISSGRFVNDCHEYIFHLTHQGAVPLDRLAVGVPYSDKSNVSRWASAGNDRRCRGNTWFLPYPTIQRRVLQRPHPASFPESLPERCLRLHGLSRIRRVLDPFLGIGSTAVACARLQTERPELECDGFEIDPDYCREAEARVREVVTR